MMKPSQRSINLVKFDPDFDKLITTGWWEGVNYAPEIKDQHFGMVLQDRDLAQPRISHSGQSSRNRTSQSRDTSGSSRVDNTVNNFKIALQLEHFKPADIEVKVVDNFVVIHAKHEEADDGCGSISREFTRRYPLSKGVKLEAIKSSMGENGVLTIEVPKEAETPFELIVPVTLQTENK